MLQSLEQIIFNLNDVNIDESVESSIIYFNQEFPYSFNFIICSIVYSYYTVESSDIVCLEYLKKLELKEKELYNTSYDIFRDVFACFLNPIHTTESFYLFEKMITNEIIEPNLCESMTTSYFFLHHMSNYKNIKQNKYTKYFYDNFGLLSKNDWELHKKLIEEGHNPNEITRIIRNDEVEKLQEISSQTNFNFNQKIKPSLYERCSFINEDYVKLIDYAAFFSSIKCFKYLLINGANIDNTGNYAVASGNEEIIHLCEQNHSLYPSAYEAAIKFHRNDIFYYLYDNQIVKIDNIEWLGVNCILCNNYEILSFLEKKGMNIYESFIIKSIVTGNFFIFQYLHEKNPITINFLEISTVSKNKEFLNYLFNNTYINKKIAKFIS